MAELTAIELKRLNINFNISFHRKKNVLVYCWRCSARVTVGDFALHLKKVHLLDCENACPFCYCGIRWRRGEIGKQSFVAQHRQTCLFEFIKSHQKPVVPGMSGVDAIGEEGSEFVVPESGFPGMSGVDAIGEEGSEFVAPESGPDDVILAPILSEFCQTCYDHNRRGAVTRHMDGRTRNPEWGDSFYEPFPDDPLFSRVQGPKHVMFSEPSGLGAHAYNIFQCFLSREYVFFHLMVRVQLWQKFRRLSWPGVHFTKFGTLCDGTHGEEPDEGRVHHRHMIVAMRGARVPEFKKQWKSVVVGTVVRPAIDLSSAAPMVHPKNKLCKGIENAGHLMYVLSYVSQKRVSCNGYGNKCGTGSHYWIFNALSPCANLALATLWKDGHATLVSRRHRDKDLLPYYHRVEKVNGSWQVLLRHLGLKEHNCVIPFAKEYELCSEEGEGRPVVYVYGRPMFLKHVPELRHLSHDDWLRHQIATGNVFWECTFDEYYALGHSLKRSMNVISKAVSKAVSKALKDVEAVRKREKIAMTRQIDELQRENKRHSEKSIHWQEQCNRISQGYVQELQTELNRCRTELKRTTTELRELRRRDEKRKNHILKQLEERLKRTEELWQQDKETLQKYHEKISKLHEELKSVIEAYSQDKVQSLEKTLEVMTRWYVELQEQFRNSN